MDLRLSPFWKFYCRGCGLELTNNAKTIFSFHTRAYIKTIYILDKHKVEVLSALVQLDCKCPKSECAITTSYVIDEG